jgi:hypothetical protein
MLHIFFSLSFSLSFFVFESCSLLETERSERSIGWAHPELLYLLRYKQLDLFIDGTFKCVPKPFEQLLILMVRDAASGKVIAKCNSVLSL